MTPQPIDYNTLQQLSPKVAKSVQAEDRDSERVRCHDRGAEADAEGLNDIIMDALRHRLHFGHTQANLSMTFNLGDFGQQSFLLPLISPNHR